jgi:potassium-transporting ATPase KdpC subunit
MKKNLITAMLMTIVTTVLLGIIYPLVVTAMAQLLFPDKANGQLITHNGKLVGSRIIGQPFTSDIYFHSRPSYAGSGYDGANSSASNLGPTNHVLIERVNASVAQLRSENPQKPVPIDLLTSSGSGLDPHITPAAAEFQTPRVAKARGMSEEQLRAVIGRHTEGRQLGFFGEPRVDVLELNLDLDKQSPGKKTLSSLRVR